jgi:hypothetical protein
MAELAWVTSALLTEMKARPPPLSLSRESMLRAARSRSFLARPIVPFL